ncbi:hypothetical protein JTE90_001514 [Oedothorax gibbosus]|uniref:Tetratricopeptide repeat protein 7 N-terminal domain-containing protein n=1 Tax=Oedothorax gibbosus TaxID=931172 RepID=A0AAV6UIG8_9ARAC|nr:hypothetical protein JTE90_001514 [Oedothorax gibbosus]
MAVRNAVLDLSPEFEEARAHSYNNVSAVYDLLTIALARRGEFHILVDSFERAMKFSFEKQHVWMQFALSLISAGKHARAYQPQRALREAERALRRETAHPLGLLARCHVAHGAALEATACAARTQAQRAGLKARAFEAFSRASSADPNDHLPEFFMALHYAQARQLNEAVQHVKMALHLRSEHVHSLHLLALLLTAQKQHPEALQLIEAALEEYPNDFNEHVHSLHLLALLLAAQKQHPEALQADRSCTGGVPKRLQHVTMTLHLRSEHVHSLHLLALWLGSSTRRHCKLIEAALEEYPNDFNEHVHSLHLLALWLRSSTRRHCKLIEAALEDYPNDFNEHVHSRHLLELLLTARKQQLEALQLIEAALEEYPNDFNLLCTKAHLEEHCVGAEVALLTSKHMLQLWQKAYQTQEMSSSGMMRVASENRSVFQIHSSEFSDIDSGSPAGGTSVANAARVEAALSEVASSISGSCFQPRPGPTSVWQLQLHIWLLVVELYLRAGQLKEADASVQEAAALFPLSHQLMVMKGRIHECKQEYPEAKICFQNAVAVNPFHVKALQHLAMVHHCLGNSRLAEKILRDAVTIDPMAHQSWFHMGKVLADMGEHSTSADCVALAIELEATCPILPFNNVPRTFE